MTQVHTICPHKCLLYCPECSICVHMFICNCADALIRTTMCKHIHLVARYKSDKTTADTDEISGSRDNTTSDSALGKQHNESFLHETSRQYLTSALNFIKAQNQVPQSFVLTKNTPPNQLIEQRSFFSTKRRRKQATVRIHKPTSKEKDEICLALLDKHRSLYGPNDTSSNPPLSRIIISK